MSIFDQIVTQANTCQTCEELQRLVDKAMPQLQTLLDGLAAQQQVLAAGQALLNLNPADLPGVIDFIGQFKETVLTPALETYAKSIAQTAQTVSGIASATSAIASAASRIGSCSIVGLP